MAIARKNARHPRGDRSSLTKTKMNHQGVIRCEHVPSSRNCTVIMYISMYQTSRCSILLYCCIQARTAVGFCRGSRHCNKCWWRANFKSPWRREIPLQMVLNYRLPPLGGEKTLRHFCCCQLKKKKCAATGALYKYGIIVSVPDPHSAYTI